MFFSQSIYGARPTKAENLHASYDATDAKQSRIKAEELTHPTAGSPKANTALPCVGVTQDPLPIRLLIPDQDRQDASPTLTTTTAPFALTTSRLADLQRPAGLKYPIERYLPPSGPYYDRRTFASVMHQGFRKCKKWCASCWMPRHGPQPSCLNKCWICATKQHTGRVSAPQRLLIHPIEGTDLVAGLSAALLRHEVVSKQNRPRMHACRSWISDST